MANGSWFFYLNTKHTIFTDVKFTWPWTESRKIFKGQLFLLPHSLTVHVHVHHSHTCLENLRNSWRCEVHEQKTIICCYRKKKNILWWKLFREWWTIPYNNNETCFSLVHISLTVSLELSSPSLFKLFSARGANKSC